MDSLGLMPFFFAGLADSYNPCSVGVLLVSLSILVGLGRKKLISIFGLSYLSMIFLTYFLIGLGFLRAFHLFGIHGFFGYVAGILLIIAGIIHLLPPNLKNVPGLRWMNKCHIPTSPKKNLEKGVFVAGIILGFLIGLCTIPCAGGIYLGSIALLASSSTYLSGVLGLFIFNLGFILPLTVIFLLSTRESALQKIKKVHGKISSYSSWVLPIIMIVMGLFLIIIS